MIQVTLESGTGHHTVPLLIAELTVNGNSSIFGFYIIYDKKK